MPIPDRLKNLLHNNQIMVVLLGIVLGLLFPTFFSPLNEYTTQLLILVFFFSSLRLSLDEIINYGKDWRLLFVTAFFMLILMPFALYLPVRAFAYDWSVALLIMGAMPTGMTIALVAEFFGGKTSLALVITAVTSLLAPITIPIVTKIALGQAVPIPMFQMFWSLFLTIVIPFILAMVLKQRIPKRIEAHDGLWRNVSVAAFGLLILGITASSALGTPVTISLQDWAVLAFVLPWLAMLIWVAYHIVPWRKPSERMTVALCMLYLNNTLALYVADKFFRDLNATPKQIMLLMAVNAILPGVKIAASRILRKT
ncbi:MAG: bile acid:sodium symporter [Patescibacteria group bacterium]